MEYRRLTFVLICCFIAIFYLFSKIKIPAGHHKLNDKSKICAPKSGLITIWDDGRLGNNMCSYATLCAYAIKYNLKPMLTPKLGQNLNIFPHLSIKPMNCEFREKDWTKFSIDEFRKTNLSLQELSKMNVKIDTYSCELPEFHHFRKNLIFEFRMEEKIERKAHSFLSRFHGPKVGIHVRRTDFVQLYGSKYHKNIPSKLFYDKVSKRKMEKKLHFLDQMNIFVFKAMNYFRQKYSNVTFIVTSDDKKWCQKFLAESNPDDVIVTSEENSRELDLAIMKHCNHSIVSVGTFGFWTGYLHLNGEVIRASSFPNPKWTQTNLPSWQLFEDPCFINDSKLTD